MRIWKLDINVTGFGKKAVDTLKSVVARYQSELDVWNDLGVKCLLSGQQEEARRAFIEVDLLFCFVSEPMCLYSVWLIFDF